MRQVRHVMLTGPPGVGKTTVVKKALAALEASAVPCAGFYTEEVRREGERCGFDIVCVDGRRGPLARKAKGTTKRARVGRYEVETESIEALCVSTLSAATRAPGTVLVVDEIGKMELKCEGFAAAVDAALEAVALSLSTIPSKRRGLPAVEAVAARSDVAVVGVTEENRDELATEVCRVLVEASRGARLDLAALRLVDDVPPAGPFGATGSALRVLLLGELASPAGSDYRDRSCWLRLDPLLRVDRPAGRLAALAEHGLALWDVARDVHVPGTTKPRPTLTNDFHAFAAAHPSLHTLCFNGRAAAAAFAAAVPCDNGTTTLAGRRMRLVVLPSSRVSPEDDTAVRAAWASGLAG